MYALVCGPINSYCLCPTKFLSPFVQQLTLFLILSLSQYSHQTAIVQRRAEAIEVLLKIFYCILRSFGY